MLRLPFVAAPYPDEIFGSWLARVCLHNAIDENLFLRKIGFTNPSHQIPFDITSFSDRVSTLCEVLETSYEDLLLNHTTLPYRLTFSAADIREGYLPGTQSLPKLACNRRNPTSVLHRINHIKTNDRIIQYCPKCLLTDYQKHGEPYWHRENQLPNIKHCHLHQVALRRTCPICQHAVLLQHGLLELPRLRCICGHNLTQDAEDILPSDGQTALTIISIKALNNRTFIHPLHQVNAFLRHTIQLIDYERSLESAFGEFQIENGSYICHSYDKKLITEIPIKYNPHRPNDFCAVLSAAKIDFESFLTSIDEFVKHNSCTPRLLSTSIVSIAEARQLYIKHTVTQCRQPNLLRRYRWYWLLRIADQEWLQSHHPKSLHQGICKLPSIEVDREEIKHALHVKGNTNNTWYKLVCSSRYHRATIRDGEWLASIRSQSLYEGQGKKQALSDLILERASLLWESLRLLSLEFGCPRVIRIRDLAEMANVTTDQAERTMYQHPELHAAFKLANRNINERKLRWALEHLISKHAIVTTNTIISKSKIWRTKSNIILAKRIISDYQSSPQSPDQPDLPH